MDTDFDPTPFVVQAMTAPKEAIAGLHSEAVKMLHAISEAEKSAKDGANVVKTESWSETKFGEDAEGLATVKTFLRSSGGVFDQIIDFVEEDPRNSFIMLKALQSTIVKYLADEVKYFDSDHTPKMTKSSDVQDAKRAFNTIRNTIGFVAGIVANTGYAWTKDENLARAANGSPVSVLKGLRGIKKSDTENGGRYGRLYHLDWIIDEVPVDTFRPAEVLRLVFPPIDRVGKSPQDLIDILDKEAPGWKAHDFGGATFTLAGHLVTITVAVGDDEDEDDEQE